MQLKFRRVSEARTANSSRDLVRCAIEEQRETLGAFLKAMPWDDGK